MKKYSTLGQLLYNFSALYIWKTRLIKSYNFTITHAYMPSYAEKVVIDLIYQPILWALCK